MEDIPLLTTTWTTTTVFTTRQQPAEANPHIEAVFGQV
jgi:hypothetical protein